MLIERDEVGVSEQVLSHPRRDIALYQPAQDQGNGKNTMTTAGVEPAIS
jgi:hypothetical protein